MKNASEFSPSGRNRIIKPLPLACHRPGKTSFVIWHSAEQVYGPEVFVEPDEPTETRKVSVYPNTLCVKLVYKQDDPSTIDYALVRNLLAEEYPPPAHDYDTCYRVYADYFVVAAGAIGTPQIFANSGFGAMRDDVPGMVKLPALGRYITEQPMTFCQIALKQEIVDSVDDFKDRPTWWRRAVEDHKARFPNDPCHIPLLDPEPQITIPVSEAFPWHTQIHRDAFSYGEAGPGVDPRIVVDLRFFGMQEGLAENRLVFEPNYEDEFEMPQPTFEYEVNEPHRRELASKMMRDMTNVAGILGGYLTEAQPQFMKPGLALHLAGTIRLGSKVEDSVANNNSQVWGFKNLFCGGNGTINTKFAANPTLTSMCLAIRAVSTIIRRLQGRDLQPDEPTPDDILHWLLDPKDPRYPKHADRSLHDRIGHY